MFTGNVFFFQYQAIPDCALLPDMNSEIARSFYDIIIQSMDVIRTWADKTPGFIDICQEDQSTLFHNAVLEVFALRIAYR